MQSPFQLFFADIVSSMLESMPDKYSNLCGIPQPNLKTLFSSLRSLLPNEQSVVMGDETFQSKLSHILLYSTANGFAGLHGIPIQSVLKYLSRYGGINLQFQGKHSPIGRAVAENLFRAAIEAKNKHFLEIET